MKIIIDRIEDGIATLVIEQHSINVPSNLLPKGTSDGDHFKLVRDDKGRNAEREKAKRLLRELQ